MYAGEKQGLPGRAIPIEARTPKNCMSQQPSLKVEGSIFPYVERGSLLQFFYSGCKDRFFCVGE